MEPIDFKESNMTLSSPGTMPNCEDLRVYTNGRQCMSCWKMSFKERIKVLFTGCVWLDVFGGRTQPPVWIGVDQPFIKPNMKDKIRIFFYNAGEFFLDAGRMIGKITKAIKTQADKKKHCIAGIIIAFIFAFISGILYGIHAGILSGMSIGFCAGVTAGTIVGLLKEIYDKTSKKGTPELMDWYATIFGSFIGSVGASIAIVLVLLFT